MLSYRLHLYHLTRHITLSHKSLSRMRKWVKSRVLEDHAYSGGRTETWANRRGLGAASAQVPRVAVMKCSVAFMSARPSEEVAGREERRTMIGHVWSEGSTEACGGTRIPRGSLTRLKSQKWWRESWALPGDAESWPLRTPLPEGEGRVSWADSAAEGEGRVSWADFAAGGRGPRVVGGLHCRRERAECRGRTPLPEGEGRVSWRTPLPEGDGRVSWRTPLPEGEGRVSWRTPLPEGDGRVSWRTPLPEGEGRVSWADSTAGGRWPSVVGGLHCRRKRAECRQNIWLLGGEPSVVREEIDGQGWEKIPTREKRCKLVVELFLRGEVM